MMPMDEKKIEAIAQVCHETNRAYCATIGDASQLPWSDAPDWQKSSAIDGVKYHLLNPNSKPSDSHENWRRHKTEDGWVFGEVKDPEAKTHPCMVPFHQLSKEQQMKDCLFLAVVRTMGW